MFLSKKILLFKLVITSIFFFLIIQARFFLGSTSTFILLDTVLSIYLFSLFKSHWRFLFLIHPIFILFSSFGFEIPYSEIGVGFTYLETFATYVNPETMELNLNLIIDKIIFGGGAFGFGKVYIGSIPIIYFPSLLFNNPPDITTYLSMSLFALLYTSIAVTIALYFQILSIRIVLFIALFSTISPTFLEINSTIHRYGFLSFGLFLFLISYSGIKKKSNNKNQSILLFLLLLISLIIIFTSKIGLILSLILFIFLD